MEKQSITLVYGTNLSGYRVAYALGKMGYKTILLNRGRYVDEFRNQVLAQLPLDLCWACAYAPQRLFVGMGAMQVLYNSELLEVKGEAGNFDVRIRKKDPYVNNYICAECDKCIEACPVEVTDPDGRKRKAIYTLPKMFWENIYLVDEEHCTHCGECEKACPTGAIHVDNKVEEQVVSVGAIVLAPEFDEPTEEDLSRFGWGRVANVVKNADVARASLATNFTRDSFRRPSDGKIPHSISVIATAQFNDSGVEYESYNNSVQAIYRANKIKQVLPEAEVTVFCRQYRGFGKGHYRMYDRALEVGIEVVRPDHLKLAEASGDRNTITYGWGTDQHQKTVDLTILVTGQKPPAQMGRLAEICGVEPDEHGFCRIEPFSCARTNREGILAVGEFTAPKGNPETVWEGYGPVSEILKHLGPPNVEPPKPPELRSVNGELPKIGVFLCSCFGTFQERMDLEALRERVEGLPTVSHAEIIQGCCTPPTMQETAQKIKASGVNRAILAVCTPTQKLMKFRKTVMMAGLNPLLTEFIRLREDVVNVHSEPEEMIRKAESLVRSATAKLKRAQAAPPLSDEMGSSALVIGGGPTGMEAARMIADRGFPVCLVEKSDRLGGMLNRLGKDLEGRDFAAYRDQLVEAVEGHANIRVCKNTVVTGGRGYAGNFHVDIQTEGQAPETVDAAIVMLAIGARERKVNAFLYGKHPGVMTQLELEEKIQTGKLEPGHVAMIQCVGSRNSTVPYCSRVCCSHALKNALDLRERGHEVTIFYRDINTYGFKEDYYRLAVEKGVVFIRFEEGRYPRVEEEGGRLLITYTHTGNRKQETLITDYLGLSVGIAPDEEANRDLSAIFGIPLDEDGYYDAESCACPYEDAAKRLMKPFELATNGVFPVGTTLAPRSVTESLLTARQAAGQALVVLPKARLASPNAMYVSGVHEALCVGCGNCVDVCPYYARQVNPITHVAEVRNFLCESCGACVVACPSGAAYIRDFKEEAVISAIDSLVA